MKDGYNRVEVKGKEMFYMEAVVKDMNVVEDRTALETLFSYLDKGIDDMEAGRLHTVDDAFQIIRDRMKNEATDDVFNLVKYIHVDLCNPDAANKLYTNLNREVNNMGDFPLKFADSGIKYRGYIIHKKIYQSYLLFYIISDENQTVYVLRILKDIMNWRNILQKTNIYHFSNYR